MWAAVLSAASVYSAQVFTAIWQNQLNVRPHNLSQADIWCCDYNDSIQGSHFLAEPLLLHQPVVLQVCVSHTFIRTGLSGIWGSESSLSSDEMTVFMYAGFQTGWLSDRACKFPQVSPLTHSLSLPSLLSRLLDLIKKKCAWSQRNNTASLAAATIITAGTHTVQPGECQSFKLHVIPVLSSQTLLIKINRRSGFFQCWFCQRITSPAL